MSQSKKPLLIAAILGSVFTLGACKTRTLESEVAGVGPIGVNFIGKEQCELLRKQCRGNARCQVEMAKLLYDRLRGGAASLVLVASNTDPKKDIGEIAKELRLSEKDNQGPVPPEGKNMTEFRAEILTRLERAMVANRGLEADTFLEEFREVIDQEIKEVRVANPRVGDTLARIEGVVGIAESLSNAVRERASTSSDRAIESYAIEFAAMGVRTAAEAVIAFEGTGGQEATRLEARLNDMIRLYTDVSRRAGNNINAEALENARFEAAEGLARLAAFAPEAKVNERYNLLVETVAGGNAEVARGFINRALIGHGVDLAAAPNAHENSVLGQHRDAIQKFNANSSLRNLLGVQTEVLRTVERSRSALEVERQRLEEVLKNEGAIENQRNEKVFEEVNRLDRQIAESVARKPIELRESFSRRFIEMMRARTRIKY